MKGEAWRGLYCMGAEGTGSDQIRPDQTKSDQTRPDQTRPDPTRPNRIRRNQTSPAVVDQAENRIEWNASKPP